MFRVLTARPRIANWFYGFIPPERGTIVLRHRRVYIVPTRLGWMFAATLGLLLVGSINYALSLGFALTFLLAGMGLAGMVHTARNLARLAVSGESIQSVCSTPPVEHVVEPDTSLASRYESQLEAYRNLYLNLEASFGR